MMILLREYCIYVQVANDECLRIWPVKSSNYEKQATKNKFNPGALYLSWECQTAYEEVT